MERATSLEQQIAQVRKNIKRKYDELRRRQEDTLEERKIKFQPLCQPLQQLVRQKHRGPKIKAEEENYEDEEENYEEDEESDPDPWSNPLQQPFLNSIKSGMFPLPGVLNLFSNLPTHQRLTTSGSPSRSGTSKIKIDKRRQDRGTSPYVVSPAFGSIATRIEELGPISSTSHYTHPEKLRGARIEEEEEEEHQQQQQHQQEELQQRQQQQEELQRQEEDVMKEEADRGLITPYGEISWEYVEKRMNNDPQCDYKYGVNFDGQQFTVGDSFLKIEDDIISIGDSMKINATKGILELLFMKKPNPAHIKEHDRLNYKKILCNTQLHRKRFSLTESYNSDPKNSKWLVIMQTLSIKQQQQQDKKTDKKNQPPKPGSSDSKKSSSSSRPGSRDSNFY